MVNEELVLNTIRKMREAGLSTPIIESTLSNLGLNRDQVASFLAKSIGENGTNSSFFEGVGVTEPVEKQRMGNILSDEEHDFIASKTSEKVHQKILENSMGVQDHHSLKDTVTHLALEQHADQLRDTHENVMGLHDKFDSANFQAFNERMSLLDSKMEKVSRNVLDSKALSSAIQTLMQKILETNQQILFELQGKKAK